MSNIPALKKCSRLAREQNPLFTNKPLSAYIIMNYSDIANKMEDADCDPKLVAMLLGQTPRSDFRLEHDILSGNLDADRADYLLRDSRTCGVCYGEYDFARFLQMFAVTLGGDQHYKLCVGENDLWQVEALLIARYHYNLQVPYHRTRSGFDIALRRFVGGLSERGFVLINAQGKDIQELDFESFTNFDDYSLMEAAKCSLSPWADYMLRKRHLVTLLDTTSHIAGGQEKVRQALEILNSSGFAAEEEYFLQSQAVAILKGAPKEQMDEPDQKEAIFSPPYGNIYLLCKDEDEPVDICERSWIFKQFRETPLNILRIYVTVEKREMMQKILRKGAA